MGAILAAAAPSLLKGVASLLGGSGPHALDPTRKALLDQAAQRGDIPYIVAWIQDQPPHPIRSVQYAQALLQRLTGMQYGGRLAQPAQQTQAAGGGYLPYRLANGQVVGIPYVTG